MRVFRSQMRLGNVIEKKLLPLAFPTEFRERPCVVMVEFSDSHDYIACVASDKSFDPVNALRSNDLKNGRVAQCRSSGNSDHHLAEQVHVIPQTVFNHLFAVVSIARIVGRLHFKHPLNQAKWLAVCRSSVQRLWLPRRKSLTKTWMAKSSGWNKEFCDNRLRPRCPYRFRLVALGGDQYSVDNIHAARVGRKSNFTSASE